MQLLSVIIGYFIVCMSVNFGTMLPIKNKSKAENFKKQYVKVSKGEFLYNGEQIETTSDFYMFKTEVTNLNHK